MQNYLLLQVIIILVLVSIGTLFIYMGCLILITKNRTLSVVSDEVGSKIFLSCIKFLGFQTPFCRKAEKSSK